MKTEAREFVRGNVVPHVARCHALGYQVPDHRLELCGCSSDVPALVQERHESRIPKMATVMGRAVVLVINESVAFEHSFQLLARIQSLVADPSEVLKMPGDRPIVPGQNDRFHVREVLVQRCTPNPGFVGNLRHCHGEQPVFGDKRRGRVEDRVADLAAVCLDGLVPELGDHARIRDDHWCDTLYCNQTGCLDKLESNGEVVVTQSPSPARPVEETAAGSASSQTATYPGTPRWVKLGAIVIVVVLVLVVAVMILSGGEHGPMRHVPSAAGIVTIGSLAPRL